MCPAARLDAHCRPQIHIEPVRALRPHVSPPIEKLRLPMLEGALQHLIACQVHVVGDLLLVIDRHEASSNGWRYTRSQLNRALFPVPKTFNAPASPTALGLMNIQFCQAERRPKMRVSMVSAGPKRRLASIPVNASGERLVRSSIASRTSSFQSSASGVTVTSPSAIASAAPSGCPIRARTSAVMAGSP